MIDLESVNVAAHLTSMARARPYGLAVVCPSGHDRAGRACYTHRTFQQLERESNQIARGLELNGIAPGTRTVLMVKPSLEFFALTFGLFKAGVVPVLIDPGMGIKNLGRCIAEAEPEAFIGIPKAHVARKVLGWGRPTIRFLVHVGRKLTCKQLGPWSLGWKPFGVTGRGDSEDASLEHSANMVATRGADVAAILFTSGSTGPPKGAIYTHSVFAAQVEMLRAQYEIEPGEIDLCTFPLFALFGPALGMTAIVPEMDATRPARVDPRKILDAIETFGVTNIFGSPALIDRVGSFGAERGVKVPSLRRVISAGAPVPARVLERFATMLEPDIQLFTPYGATEALPVCSIGSREILSETRHATDRGAGVCVGRPARGMSVEVIRIGDEPIAAWSDDLLVPDGEIGEIVVRGPVVTRAYINRPDATALAKVADPAQAAFWHRMGDVGYRDSDGRIWFCGRKSHRVITEQGTLYTIPCEAIFNTHARVKRTALVGVGPPAAARPVLCVELDRGVRWRGGLKRFERELLELGAQYPHTRSITTFLVHPSFPVDIRHNAKIFREKLAVWAAGKLA